MKDALARLAFGVAVLAVAAPVRAQVSVQQQVNPRQVAVGEPVYVQFTALATSGRPTASDAKLPVAAGLRASGPNVSSQTQMTINNGQMSQRVGVTLTWTVTASRPGTYRLGPPSMVLDGQAVQGQAVSIEVVAGGGSPRAPRGQSPFDPFDFLDPFGRGRSPFPPGFGLRSPLDDDDQVEQAPSFPEEFRVDKAPDPIAFLRATATPDHAVIGEQVTLRIYAYGGRGPYREANPTEPFRGDFLTYTIDNPQAQHAYEVPVSGTRFVAVKLRELALFPLHAGTLRAGAMRMGFDGRTYPPTGPNLGLVRESNSVDVIVTEPPLAGRPPGYRLGDVGDFKLNATLEPRTVTAGDAVSVVVTVEGVGNPPYKLVTPERRDTEWLEPTITERVEPSDGIVKGWRRFGYVVRLTRAGMIDLGEVTLPFYDPKHRTYQVARARLGSVTVNANPNAPQVAATDRAKTEDRLRDVLKPRTTLGPTLSARAHLDDRVGFWGLLWLGPLGVVLAGSGITLGTRFWERRRARAQSIETELKLALKDLRTAAASGDARASAYAAERATFLGIEAKLGFKARAVLKAELAPALVARGLSAELAAELAKILEDCDTLRFVGAAGGVSTAELSERVARAVAQLSSARLSRS